MSKKPWTEGEPSECDGSAWDRLPPLVQAEGYEIQCSPWMAELLGAWFGSYRGPGIFHYDQGHLWWIARG